MKNQSGSLRAINVVQLRYNEEEREEEDEIKEEKKWEEEKEDEKSRCGSRRKKMAYF